MGTIPNIDFDLRSATLGKAEARPAETARPGAPEDPLTPTLFHSPWWLNIVGRGSYEEAQVSHKNGQLAARLPYVVSRWRGFRVSMMPDLTHALGPAIDEGNGSPATRALHRYQLMSELASKVPARLGLFSQTCHRRTVDILAFQGQRFDSSVHFTHEIAPAPEAELWAGMRDKTRNVIRRADERCTVEEILDPEHFRDFYMRNLREAGRHSYFDAGLTVPLFVAAHARDQARILMTRDERGQPTAAVFYVWDQDSLYYFMSSRDRRASDNGAVSLLVWHAIREAGRRGLMFDFDGVSSEGSARFYAGFGGAIAPRFGIHRSAPSLALLKSAAALFKRPGRNFFTGP